MDNCRIGFVGLGRIGFPVALNLARRGFVLRGFDLAPTDEVVTELTAAGATIEDDPARVAEDADVLVTLLPDSAAVESVLFSAAVRAQLRPGMVCIDMSSSLPEDTERIGERLATDHGVALVDAPICNGGVPGAYEGRLVFCVGGDDAAVQHARAVLDPIAEHVAHVGPLGAGHTIKLISNYIALGVSGLVSEAYAIGVASGFRAQAVADALQHCVVGRFIHTDHLDRVLFADDSPKPVRFRLALGRKDLRYLVSHAARTGVISPVADGVHEQYLLAERSGLADHEATKGPWALLSASAQHGS